MKNDAEWSSKRECTKFSRKRNTDSIKKFVDYALSQGSKNANRYYGNFSRMALTHLFIIEQRPKNARDMMTSRQLKLIELADDTISDVIENEILNETPYKEIFKIAKSKIESIASLFDKTSLSV